MMAYKHRVTQALADFINKYGGGSHDPFMAAVWYGIKSQVPLILQALDSNEEAIAEIEKQLRKALGIEPEPVVTPIEEVKIEVKPIPTEEKPKQEKQERPKKLPKQKENI